MQVRMKQAAYAVVLSTVALVHVGAARAVCEEEAGAPVVLRPVRDTRIMRAHPSANDGSAGLIWLKRSSDVRGLVGFDLSCQAAATHDVSCAGFEVSIHDGLPTLDGATFSAHRMRVPWIEGNQSFNEFSFAGKKLGSFGGTGAGTTWDCRVDADVSDATSEQCADLDRWDGADDCGGAPCYDRATSTAFFADDDQRTLGWEVTGDVVDTEGEESWLLKVEDETSQSGSVKFYTRNGADFMGSNETLPGGGALFDEAPRLLLWGSGFEAPGVTLVASQGLSEQSAAAVRITQESDTIGSGARWTNFTTGDWGWMSPDGVADWTASVPLGVGANEIEFTVYDACGTEGKLREWITHDLGESCGNGIVESDEECDDGNLLDGDCCSSACARDADGSGCEDGDVCTVADSCQAGVCTSGSVRPSSCGRSLLCYGARETPDATDFERVFDLELADDLEAGLFDVKRLTALCAPSDVEGEGSVAADVFGLGYAAKRSSGEPAHQSEKGIVVTDRFGTVTVDTVKPDWVIVPAAFELGAAAGRIGPGEADHFKCYRVSMSGPDAFPNDTEVRVTDVFEDRVYAVKRPSQLCYPVSGFGPEVQNPDAHLMCYRVTRLAGEPRHEKVEGLIHTTDVFGPLEIDSKPVSELCVTAELG